MFTPRLYHSKSSPTDRSLYLAHSVSQYCYSPLHDRLQGRLSTALHSVLQFNDSIYYSTNLFLYWHKFTSFWYLHAHVPTHNDYIPSIICTYFLPCYLHRCFYLYVDIVFCVTFSFVLDIHLSSICLSITLCVVHTFTAFFP